MTSLSPKPAPGTEGAQQPSASSGAADSPDIVLLGIHKDFDANYETLMTEFVEAEWPDEKDKKSKRTAQRLLNQPISRHLLSIVWKETLLSDQELIRAGVKKVFLDCDLNCRRLAIHLSDEPCDVDANTALFRRILTFACKLNLVAVTRGKGKSQLLAGTSTLDAFMRELANIQKQALKALDRGGCGDA